MPAPTQYTFLTMQQEVLLILDQATNSAIGDLPSGSGGLVTQGTTATLKTFLNEGLKRLARRAYPIQQDATITVSANTKTFPVTSIVTADGSSMFAVLRLGVGGADLSKAGISYLNIYRLLNAPGVPANWYRSGQGSIGLAPYPTASTAVTVTGFVTPPDLSADGDTAGWLEPDLYKLPVFYAAARMGMKGAQDASLAPRAELWMKEFEEGEEMLRQRLKVYDPPTASLFFGIPEIARSN